jgi:hypothetical protein
MNQRGKQRPELVDVRPREALFSSAGQTGWLGRRDISEHKGNKNERDFSHLHGKFVGPEDAA